MRRTHAAVPWAASLILHGAVLGVAAYFVDDSQKNPAPELVAIDIVDAPAPVEAVAENPVESGPGEVGRPAAGDPALGSTSKRGAPPARLIELIPTPAVSELSEELIEPSQGVSVTEALGIEIGGEGLGGMSEAGLGGQSGDGFGGFGGGTGRGRGGNGTGRGRGATKAKSIGSNRARSKARPARLIYPKRFRKERPGEVFVVVLMVDAKGAVDGVRLKQGVNPHDDGKALDAVWRFRYDPALDRDGRPIKSRVVQRFMVD